MIEQLVEAAWRDLDERRASVSIKELEEALDERPTDRPFSEALATPGLSLIAEFKRRSPAAGELGEKANVGDLVRAYERGGAVALSLLTERTHFGGSLDDLKQARDSTRLPILRKDFIVDTYMLYEAAVAGADAVLLIVTALSKDELNRLYTEANALDLDCLVEVHSEKELELALELGADVIGINNRNLDDFSVDVQRTFDLISDVPAGKTVVSESGITAGEQIDRLEGIGVDAVLVGEALMRSDDPEELCRRLSKAEHSTQA